MEWVIPAVVVGIVGWLLLTYNRMVSLRQTTMQAFADIEVQLKQRHDLVPNLVETVKGYASHESKTLEAVIAARNKATSAQSPAEMGAAEGALTGALGRIFALAEAYPDLKADANFRQLQAELSDLENKIAAARRFLNNAVQEYNTSIQQLPAVLIADMAGFKPAEFFALAEPERAAAAVPPSVKF